MPPARVVDVENALVWGKSQTVWHHKIPHQHMDRAQVWRDTIHPAEIQLRFDPAEPRIREIDAPVRLHHNVVRAVQALAVIVIRHDGDTAIRVLAGDTS